MRQTTKEKLQYIEEQEKKYFERVARLNNKFIRALFSYFTTNLDVRDGVIRNTIKNLVAARKVSDIQEDFVKKQTVPIVRSLAISLLKLHDINKKYFKAVADTAPRSVDKAHSAVASKLAEYLGFSDKKNIKSNSYLEDLAMINDPFQKVKAEALKAVTARIPLKEFRENIKTYVNEQQGLEGHFKRLSGDIYSQFERESSNQTRVELGLVFAQYSRGLIGTSRDFCKERNGKVFHESEVELFGTVDDTYGGYTTKPEFMGKSKPYNPFVDLGGYNCRHVLDWISTRRALRIRPDAKRFIDEN